MRLSAESNNKNPEAKPHQLGDFLSCFMFSLETFASLQSTSKKILYIASFKDCLTINIWEELHEKFPL